MIDLIGLSKEQLSAELTRLNEKPFRAKQLWKWLYHYGVTDFNLMTDLSLEARTKLGQNYLISRPTIAQDLISNDGTRKWLLKFSDGEQAETVFIPEEKRGTLCISSQVGCTLTCKFCHTGTQLLVRNLTAGEIVGQLMLAKDLLKDWPKPGVKGSTSGNWLTNVVFMGMGEPLFNYDNLAQAVKILNDNEGLNLSRRKIVVSTSGVVPQLLSFASEIKTSLAISLHGADDELRSKLMPINKKYPLKELMSACKHYQKINPSQRITFEYVMLKEVNDRLEDAKNLIRLLKQHQLPAMINLIPFNPWEGTEYQCSDYKTIESFSKELQKAGYITIIRKTRGQDVMAACGQLKSDSVRKKKSMVSAGTAAVDH